MDLSPDTFINDEIITLYTKSIQVHVYYTFPCSKLHIVVVTGAQNRRGLTPIAREYLITIIVYDFNSHAFLAFTLLYCGGGTVSAGGALGNNGALSFSIVIKLPA